jgi:hypothetical protein
MRKIFLSASAALLCCCMGCNNDAKTGGVSAATQKNLDAAHAINKAIETGDVSKLGDYIAADAVDHGDHGDVKGVDSIKAELAAIHTSGNNMKVENIKELADDEYVFQWMRMTGTNSDPAMMPVGPYDMNAIQVSKFKDGKAIEHWSFMQPADMMKMMPPPPPMGGDMKMMQDTSKMKH